MEDKAPNIVIILADDLGYGDLQCYNNQSQIPTPHLDQLSKEGLLFTDAHSGSAVCTPTRYGLITGRYAFRSPLHRGVLGGFSKMLIEENRFTIADLMKQAGYTTGVIGKWHLGLNWPKKDSNTPDKEEPIDLWPSGENLNISADLTLGPNNLGFDYSYIIPSSLDIPPYLYLENGKPSNRNLNFIKGNNKPRGVFWRDGEGSVDFKIEETLDHLIDKSKEFLVRQSKESKPFMLYLPLTSPHTPWLPGDNFKDKSKAGIYGDFVAHTDDAIGQVLRTLDSLGLKENTIVIFTSDNGADWNPSDKKKFPEHKANGIFRGQKSDIYEGGHHIPFIVRWPAKIKHARKVDAITCINDLMATFAAISGQELPKNAGQDSFDFSPLLSDNPTIKTIRSNIIHHSIEGMFSIRKDQWKFIDGNGSGGWSTDTLPVNNLDIQLYDLNNDPSETVNLALEKPKIVEELNALLKAQKSQGFTRSTANDK